ncbi:MAG: Mpo1-like protein [Shewanella sp.]
MGSGLVLLPLGLALVTQTVWLIWLIPIAGSGFAWVGHLVFERHISSTA